MQQKQSKEQSTIEHIEKLAKIIEHIKKLMYIVWPGESLHKVFERYEMDWTPELVDKLDFKTWVYLWDKLCTTEQKRADAWIVLIAEKEVENIETTK